jgi:putative hydrolase of the HAD superfamily
MTKAVLFDLGGVLFDNDGSLFYRRISKSSGENLEITKQKLFPLVSKYEKGELNSESLRLKANELFDLNFSKEEFFRIYGDVAEPHSQNIKILKKLAENYDIGIISDIGEIEFQYFVEPSGILEYCNFIVLSFRVGVCKPDIEIYKKLLRKTDCSVGEILYIDDKNENITAAEQIGMTCIHLKEINQLKKQLRASSVLF